ncbi:MAG: hypothetical protein JSR70_07595 [Proteobacteria bacterium]|nr:hypothetical protein [Pseudomonadota bacterium]
MKKLLQQVAFWWSRRKQSLSVVEQLGRLLTPNKGNIVIVVNKDGAFKLQWAGLDDKQLAEVLYASADAAADRIAIPPKVTLH